MIVLSFPSETDLRYPCNDQWIFYWNTKMWYFKVSITYLSAWLPPGVSSISVHQEISGELYRQFANYLEGKNARFMPLPSLSAYSNRSSPSFVMSTNWTTLAARTPTWWSRSSPLPNHLTKIQPVPAGVCKRILDCGPGQPNPSRSISWKIIPIRWWRYIRAKM